MGSSPIVLRSSSAALNRFRTLLSGGVLTSAGFSKPGRYLALIRIECIGGRLPQTQQRLVEAWAEIHLEELMKDWTLLQSGQPPVKIEPLR